MMTTPKLKVHALRGVSVPDHTSAEDKYARDDHPEAKERLRRFYNGEWHFLGIRAEAEIRIDRGTHWVRQFISSPGVWGIESDSDPEYIESILREEYAELVEILAAFGIEVSVTCDEAPFIWPPRMRMSDEHAPCIEK